MTGRPFAGTFDFASRKSISDQGAYALRFIGPRWHGAVEKLGSVQPAASWFVTDDGCRERMRDMVLLSTV